MFSFNDYQLHCPLFPCLKFPFNDICNVFFLRSINFKFGSQIRDFNFIVV